MRNSRIKLLGDNWNFIYPLLTISILAIYDSKYPAFIISFFLFLFSAFFCFKILSISFLNEIMACSKLFGLDLVVEFSIFNRSSYSNFLIKACADYLEQPKN